MSVYPADIPKSRFDALRHTINASFRSNMKMTEHTYAMLQAYVDAGWCAMTKTMKKGSNEIRNGADV